MKEVPVENIIKGKRKETIGVPIKALKLCFKVKTSGFADCVQCPLRNVSECQVLVRTAIQKILDEYEEK